MRDKIHTQIKVCKTLQINKNQNFKYGYLPLTEAGSIPWDMLLLYLKDPYKIRIGGHDNPLTIKSLTMINSATKIPESNYNHVQPQ